MIKAHCVYVSAPTQALPLRGGEYWNRLARGLQLRYKVLRWFRPSLRKIPLPQVNVNAPIPTPPVCPSLLFVCMPSVEVAVKVITSFRENGSAVIVDYVGDVLGVTHIDDMSPGAKTAGATNTQETREYWSRSEVLEALATCLHSATAITTSFPEFIPGLARFTEGKVPVFHLPDLPSAAIGDVLRFSRNFTEIMKAL